MPELTLDDDGRVIAMDSEGETTDLGHVSDDWNCPPELLDEWAVLYARWTEECDEGRAELQMLKAEYYQSIGGW